MEVKGENFVKNLEIEMQKAKLKQETEKLDKQKEESVLFTSTQMSYDNNTVIDELDDIVLEDKEKNKQKYIVLGFALILLFLITIIIIRLLSQPDNKNTFTDDIILDEKQELNVIDNNDIDNIDNNDDNIDVIKNDNLIINTIEQKDEIKNDINSSSNMTPTKEDLFDINKIKKEKISTKKNSNETIKNNIEVDKTNKTINKKELFKKLVKELPKKNNTVNKVKGYYIQIGAFSKSPNKKLVKILDKNNLSYTFYKIKIKNKYLNKFLVGPYSSNNNAKNQLSKIRKLSKNKSAYIIRFK